MPCMFVVLMWGISFVECRFFARLFVRCYKTLKKYIKYIELKCEHVTGWATNNIKSEFRYWISSFGENLWVGGH